MIKKIVILFVCLFASTSFAAETLSCPQATETNNPAFCASFQTAAKCQCTSRGVPSGMCKDMDTLYKRMVIFYGSVENACSKQTDTSKQVCIDDWSCYRNGGKDSQGRLCSSTGKACQ